MPRGLTPRDIQNIQSDVLICNNIISLIIVLQSNPAFKNDTYILQDIKESIQDMVNTKLAQIKLDNEHPKSYNKDS